MTRGVLAFGFAVLLVLVLLMWAMSYFGVGYGTPTYWLELYVGGISFVRCSSSENFCLEPTWYCHGFHFTTYWKARYRFDGGLELVRLPLWIPTLIFAGMCLYLYFPIWRRRRRGRAGACLDCGYDLTGNLSGVCPECGNAVRQEESAARPRKVWPFVIILAPIVIVIAAPIGFVLIRDAVCEPGESLVQRAYRICGAYQGYGLVPAVLDPHIHEARHSKLTREELIASWEEAYPIARRIPDCNEAIVDAGFDIAERWDGKPKR